MNLVRPGTSAPLGGTAVEVLLEWRDSATARFDVDLCSLVVDADGRVREDGDLVFFNNSTHASGAVTHRGRAGTTERVAVDLAALPDRAAKVVLVAASADAPLREVAGLLITVRDPDGAWDELRLEAPSTGSGTAVVLGELHRGGGSWELRAVGESWDSGLAGVVSHFGVHIAAPDEPGPAPDETPSDERREPGLTSRFVPTAATEPVVDLDGAPATQLPGQVAALPDAATERLWVRVTFAQAGGPGRTDLGAIAYDGSGAPAEVVDFAHRTSHDAGVRLISKPVGHDAQDTAAVEVRLGQVAGAINSVVVAVTSYDGASLSTGGALVAELVVADGSTLVRTECPAPDTSAALLLGLVRADSGWRVTALAVPTAGRTADGVVGAGRWSLEA